MFHHHFFLLRSEFDIELQSEKPNILQVASALELKALELAGNPEKLFSIPPLRETKPPNSVESVDKSAMIGCVRSGCDMMLQEINDLPKLLLNNNDK